MRDIGQFFKNILKNQKSQMPNLNLATKLCEELRLYGINMGVFERGEWRSVSLGRIDNRNLKTGSEIYYDLASLTKTFVATILVDSVNQNRLKLDTEIGTFLPFLKDFNLTVEQLLEHSSLLQLTQKFDKSVHYSKLAFLKLITENLGLDSEANGKYQYSDLNYIFLGMILEEIFEQNLEMIMCNWLSKNNIQDITYKPLENSIEPSIIAKSEEGVSLGLPQDEKTRYLEGVAGHAGLFGTLSGLQQFVECWINNSWRFEEKLYSKCFTPRFGTREKSSFGLVWRIGRYSDLPNHAGYSGPVIILDPKKKIGTIITTNLHYPERNLEKREKYVEIMTSSY